jgi:hypothetical protein
MIKKLQLPSIIAPAPEAEGKRIVHSTTRSANTTVSTSNQNVLTSVEYSLKGDRNLKISIYVPNRATSDGARGLIIETTVIINGTEYSLGTSGIATNSDVSGTITIGSYTNTKLLTLNNLIKDCGVIKDTTYTLIFKIYAKTTSGSIWINDSHDINRASSGQVGTNIASASNQNFLSATIKEI